jgi:hypothetical protein
VSEEPQEVPVKTATADTPTVQPYETVCPGYGHRDHYNPCQRDCPHEERCQAITDTMGGDEADEETTVTLTAGGVTTEPMTLDEFVARCEAIGEEAPPPNKPRPDYAVMDRNTGEVVQLSLLGAQWEAYKVESLRWSLSGGDECIRTIFDELVTGGELSPGAIVEVTARGVVKEHAPIYRKDGHEGKTVISLQVLHGVHVLGHMTGPVEAAQNVDGEGKVLEGVD